MKPFYAGPFAIVGWFAVIDQISQHSRRSPDPDPRAVFGFYPCPFVDVAKLGYPQVLINMAGFVVFFSLVGSILVLVDRVIGHFSRAAPAAVARPS